MAVLCLEWTNFFSMESQLTLGKYIFHPFDAAITRRIGVIWKTPQIVRNASPQVDIYKSVKGYQTKEFSVWRNLTGAPNCGELDLDNIFTAHDTQNKRSSGPKEAQVFLQGQGMGPE